MNDTSSRAEKDVFIPGLAERSQTPDRSDFAQTQERVHAIIDRLKKINQLLENYKLPPKYLDPLKEEVNQLTEELISLDNFLRNAEQANKKRRAPFDLYAVKRREELDNNF